MECAQPRNRFLERLQRGESIVCAEGYVFELERRGYLQAGPFVPLCVLEHPQVVRQLHLDFVHAGSDVVEALTYYGHREKLRLVGKEDALEQLNLAALRIAKEVADETGTLFAGNICNSNLWEGKDQSAEVTESVREMFVEQIKWAKQAGVDFVIAETFGFLGEALLANRVIKEEFDLPSVVTIVIHQDGKTRDGYSAVEALLALEKAGADVVGFNCYRGPATMLPLIESVAKVIKTPLAALPVPYRTTEQEPTFFCLKDDQLPKGTVNGRPFPVALDGKLCTRFEIAEFTERCKELGVRYFGVCCGAGPHHIRSMAEALGRQPPASRFSPDISKHFAFGTNAILKPVNLDHKDKL